jgi:para-nitrobenzyl esterase
MSSAKACAASTTARSVPGRRLALAFAVWSGLAGAALPGIASAAPPLCAYTVEPGLVYGTGLLADGRRKTLQLDLYLPRRCDGAKVLTERPSILVVHGGGFITGTRDEPGMVAIASRLARAGYVAASITYRLRTDRPASETYTPAQLRALFGDYTSAGLDDPPESPASAVSALIAMEDLGKARDWLDARADAYDIDVSRAGLIGSSAGAATVLSKSYVADDLALIRHHNLATVSLWGNFAPVDAMEPGENPLLLVHGTEDTTVTFESTDKILLRAAQVGVRAERIPLVGEGHTAFEALFTNTMPGTETPVWDAVIAFFDRELGLRR